MMRDDSLNLHGYPVITKLNALSSHICSAYKDESKGIIVHETLSHSCSTDEDESKVIIVNETLLHSCSTDEDELCSTEEDKAQCAIKKQKYAKNEVTCDVLNYFISFNVFKCREKLLDRLDVTYERACMATPR